MWLKLSLMIHLLLEIRQTLGYISVFAVKLFSMRMISMSTHSGVSLEHRAAENTHTQVALMLLVCRDIAVPVLEISLH